MNFIPVVCLLLLLSIIIPPTLALVSDETIGEWRKAAEGREGIIRTLEEQLAQQTRRIEQLEDELRYIISNGRESKADTNPAQKQLPPPPPPAAPRPPPAAPPPHNDHNTPLKNYDSHHLICPLSLSTIPSPTSPDSGSTCVSHPQLLSTICQMVPFYVNNENIRVNLGGEKLDSVMGQEEDVEYPKYTPGAFSSGTMPKGYYERPHNWFLNKVMKGFVEVTPKNKAHDHDHDRDRDPPPPTDCVKGTTYFMMRYEYVNLFHTMTDFFVAFETITSTLESHDPLSSDYQMVWLDGHPEGNLDTIWSRLFNGHPTYVKQLPKNACFERAVIIPAGYTSAIWTNNRSFSSPPCPRMMDSFANFVLARYGLSGTQRVPRRVVIIDRVPYTAHPRSKPHMPRVLGNLGELKDSLEAAGADVHVVQFESMTFDEQLLEVREASVLVGVHGAGLTHLLFMSDGATVVELSVNGLDMFQQLERWRDQVKYVQISIGQKGGQGNYHINGGGIKQIEGLAMA